MSNAPKKKSNQPALVQAVQNAFQDFNLKEFLMNFDWNKIKAFWKRHKPSQKATRILSLILVLVMLLLIALSSFHIASLSSMRDSLNNAAKSAAPGGGFPYQVNSASVEKIGVLSGDIFLLKDTETVSLSNSAKETCKKPHSYANPAMSINGHKALVYNRGERRYRIETRTDIVYEGQTDEGEDIITACIGKKGNIALATLSPKATSRLTVINSSYKKTEFIWNCAEHTITSVSLSENGKYVACSVIGAKDGKSYSKVFVFDFAYEDPVCTFEYPGTAIISVNFTSNSNLVAVGDNKISFIRNLKKNNETDFETSVVSGLCYTPGGETVVVLAEYGSMNCQSLRCYNAAGRTSFERKYTEQIKSVTASDSRITVLCNTHVDSYGLGGHRYRRHPAKSNSISAFRCNGKTYLYENGNISKAHGHYKAPKVEKPEENTK